MSAHIVDIDPSNAQQMLIEESQNRLVMVDFWADWCEPCKSLMPILEKLANEYNGQFLLARVNTEEQQMLASQFQVRSLPTVMLIKDGQPVDGFAGAQTENAVREILDKHLPKPWDIALEQAQGIIAEGNHSEALPILRQAYEDSGQRSDIGITLAHVYLELNRVEEAEVIVGAIPMVDQDASYQQVKALLELKLQAGKSPEIEALEAQLNEDPNNLDVAYQLALAFSQDGHHREALELLYSILRENLNFHEGAVKKTMMDLTTSLGKGDPLAVEYQRKVYTLLY